MSLFSFKKSNQVSKAIVSFFMAMALVIATVTPFQTVNAATGDTTITIFHTNDMHGNLASSSSVIGIDKIAAMKANTENSLLIDAGDATQGVPFATLTKGADVITLMNEAGYDGMVTGNHEYDYGTSQLLTNAASATFPIIASNVTKDGEPLLAGTYNSGADTNNGTTFIKEVNGIKIGFFGILTTETETATNPTGIVGVTFEDEITSAKAAVSELKEEGAQVIIGICHLGDEESVPCTSEQLATALSGTGVTALIDGHSHTIENKTVGDILIAQTGTAEANLGQLILTVSSSGTVTSVKEEMLSYSDMADVTPVASLTEQISEITESQSAQLSQKIGTAVNSLWGGSINNVNEGRTTETNLGDLIADAMVANVKEMISAGTLSDDYSDLPVVAIENGGGIRTTIKNGSITLNDIVTVLPFGNTIKYKEITPDVLYEVMENSVSYISGQDSETGYISSSYFGGFLQFSGMTVEYNPNGTTGSKVTAIYLDGQETALDKTDKTTKILLASNDYLIAGGNDYTMLSDLSTLGEGTGLDTVLMDYIKEIKTVEVSISEKRLIAVSDYVAKDYTAKVYVADESGNVLANTKVTYYVDNGEACTGKTNKNGVLSFTVSDGPHAIKLADTGYEALVDNYTGLGTMEVTSDEGVKTLSYPTITLTTKDAKSSIVLAKVSSFKLTEKTASAKLSWSAVTGATGYEIYGAVGEGTYKLVATTTSTSKTIKSLSKSKTYTYKVRAYTEVNGTKVYGKFSTEKVWSK